MTDDNATVRRHHRNAIRHLERLHAARERVQQLAAQHLAATAVQPVSSPAPTETEPAP